jgi:TM2 domain-containing membrane protein YozV
MGNTTLEYTNSEAYSSGTSFVLWLACLFGICGVHRFYLGKPITGLLYVLTFGLFGIGQIVDLFFMREMVLMANTKDRLLGPRREVKLLSPARPQRSVNTEEELRVNLVQTASKNGGQISVSQGVMATGKSFEKVEGLLDEMAKSGYVGIDNHPETGAVVYTFDQLGS